MYQFYYSLEYTFKQHCKLLPDFSLSTTRIFYFSYHWKILKTRHEYVTLSSEKLCCKTFTIFSHFIKQANVEK